MIRFNTWLRFVFVAILFAGNGALLAQGGDEDVSIVEKDWRLRLSPCPHHCEWKGEVSVDATELVLLKPPSSSACLSAAVEDVRRDVVRLCGSSPRVAVQRPADAAYVLSFREDGRSESPLAVQADTPQGYQIATSPSGDVPALLLAGHDSAGALYASQTLRQLLRANGKKQLVIPQVTVVDAPDLDDRGYFLDVRREPRTWDLEGWKRHVDWAAEQRFNTILVLITDGNGLGYPSRAFAEFVNKEHPLSAPGLLRAVIAYGRRRAVRIVPTIPHIDVFLLDLFKSSPDVMTSITWRDKERHVVDYRRPEAADVLRRLVRDLVEVARPEELSVWPTEAPWQTAEDSLVQTMALFEACGAATEKGPRVTLRMLTTPITFGVSQEMFDRLPSTVKVDYYGGMHTYTLRGMRFHEETILALHRREFHFATMPAFGRLFWQGAPLAIPQLTRANAIASAAQGARGLVANGGDQPTTFAVNYAAGAEFAWNLSGRTVPEFLQTWAHRRRWSPAHRVVDFYSHLEKASIGMALANRENLLSDPLTALEALGKGNAARRRKQYIEPLEDAVAEALAAAEEAKIIGAERLIAEAEVIRSLSAALLALHRGFAARDEGSADSREHFAAAQEEFKRLEEAWTTIQGLNPGTVPDGPVVGYRHDLQDLLTSLGDATGKD